MKLKQVLLYSLPFVVALIVACTLTAQEPGVVAHDAWVRMPMASKTDAALYLVLENHTSQSRAVVSASSDAAAKLELHEMKTVKKDDSMAKPGESGDKSMGGSDSMSMSTAKPADQSMMTMAPVNKFDIPANGKVSLAPDGLHIMMFGLKSKLAVGDKISVTMKLDDGSSVPVVATVK
jgi:copper(I)-binding protein